MATSPAELQVTNQQPKPSLLREMAGRYGVEPEKMKETLIKTVFSKCQNVSNEQFIAFLIVANQYNLNPFTREIYAFPSEGGIVPIVPIDGWVSIVQRHPQYDGIEQIENFTQDDEIYSVTTKIYRKDQARPTIKTEYYDECVKKTGPWDKWPIRMLGHKSYIQCARYAFGLSGIYDPDEGERIIEAEMARSMPELPAEIKRASEIIPTEAAVAMDATPLPQTDQSLFASLKAAAQAKADQDGEPVTFVYEGASVTVDPHPAQESAQTQAPSSQEGQAPSVSKQRGRHTSAKQSQDVNTEPAGQPLNFGSDKP